MNKKNINREELIKNELIKTTGYVNYNNWANTRTTFGYHSFDIEEIKIRGQRNPKERLEVFKKYINFEDKNVIDFGCNVGAMLFHLPEIKKGIGFDFDGKCIEVGNNIKKILKNSKTELHVFDFDKDDFNELKSKIDFNPDIMFILSIGAWIKNIIKILELCVEFKGVIVLETNNDVVGKKELDFFINNNIPIKLISDNSNDDVTIDNKKTRKTYLINIE